jgi:N-terminal domain of NWD NACHT-NTPase
VNDAQVVPTSAEPVTTVPDTANTSSSRAAQAHFPPPAPPITDPPAEADPRREECHSMTKPTEQQNQGPQNPELQNPELSTSQRLWNAAYENLENNDNTTKLVKSYVKTLMTVLKAKRASDTSASEVDDISAELKDPVKRQTYMRDLVEEGRKKIATTSKITEGVDNVIGYIDKAKGMIDAAIGNIPQAALPWAGVCLGLQVRYHPLYFVYLVFALLISV